MCSLQCLENAPLKKVDSSSPNSSQLPITLSQEWYLMLTSPLHDGISPVSVFPLRKGILRLQECTTLPGFIWFCFLSSHLLSPSLMGFNIIIRKIGTREAYGRESSVLNAQPEKVSRQKPRRSHLFFSGDSRWNGVWLALDFGLLNSRTMKKINFCFVKQTVKQSNKNLPPRNHFFNFPFLYQTVGIIKSSIIYYMLYVLQKGICYIKVYRCIYAHICVCVCIS